MRSFRYLAAVLFVGIVGAAGVAAASLRSLLHVERTIRPDVSGAQVVEITTTDSVILKASWLAPPPGSTRCVLFLHGIGGWRERASRFTPLLRENHYGLLAPDSRAHGESGGERVTFGLLEKYDAVAWAKWMRARGCEKVYGLGESMGSSVLILAAEVEPVFAAIVADSPFADVLDAAKTRIVGRLPLPEALARPIATAAVMGDDLVAQILYGYDFSTVSPVESIKHVHTPILLIHGTADSRTPAADSKALAAANPDTTELWLVEGAEHVRSFRIQPREYAFKVLNWFEQH